MDSYLSMTPSWRLKTKNPEGARGAPDAESATAKAGGSEQADQRGALHFLYGRMALQGSCFLA